MVCTSSDEPLLVDGAVSRVKAMSPNEKVKNCTGYCIGKQIMINGKLKSTAGLIHVRNLHFTCLPINSKTDKFCNTKCTTKAVDVGSPTFIKYVAPMKAVLVADIGDFDNLKVLEKVCCCKNETCAAQIDASLRLSMQTAYKIE
ncbi:unnamed protein product [Caenorhabditis auriculariae]|uniref:Uncharacterized protein n=1 Tax=Caenorhabditis auriculariae TaxID=2777116 RepID=A0A8S1HXA6_9PELO|nr:unnamed protein product [Caenorhabditis auriculariae]